MAFYFRRTVFAIALGVCCSTSLVAREIPFLSGHVIDEAGILEAGTRETLESQLATHEAETSNQVVVLIIPSLDGEVLEEYSLRVAETYKLGQADKDNGVLLLIARDDRKLRIEVGYGLEGSLTDALSSRIIRNEIVPHFRDGDFDRGVASGTDAILAAIAGEYTVDEPQTTTASSDDADESPGWAETIGDWIATAIGATVGLGFLLYGAFMGLSFLWMFFQYTFFEKSWVWFIIFGPILAVLFSIPILILWDDGPHLWNLIGMWVLIGLVRVWLRYSKRGQEICTKMQNNSVSKFFNSTGSSSSGYSSGSSYSSSSYSSSSSSYSGGGGSFGGGGSSGSW